MLRLSTGYHGICFTQSRYFRYRKDVGKPVVKTATKGDAFCTKFRGLGSKSSIYHAIHARFIFFSLIFILRTATEFVSIRAVAKSYRKPLKKAKPLVIHKK